MLDTTNIPIDEITNEILRRDFAILELLISTGMRVGEITRLKISDMNFQGISCVILGKRNSEK